MQTIDSLSSRVREIRTLLLQWCKRYEELYWSHTSPEQAANGKQYDTLGIYLAQLILINRLSVSLNPRAGLGLEIEAQDLARRIIQLEQTASTVNPRASVFMAFKVIAAQATLDTKVKWQQAIRLSIEDYTRPNPVISSHVFKLWTDLKGRRTTEVCSKRAGRQNSGAKISSNILRGSYSAGCLNNALESSETCSL